MKNTLRVAGAYVGAIIGAGYASGQEILQFFTSYGWIGIIGSVITVALYPLLGYFLVVLGDQLQATSHKSVIYRLCGKYLGIVMDILIVFFLFGVGVIMVAGSGALFNQQFGVTPVIGYLVLTILIILTLTLNIHKIVTTLSVISPYAFALIIILALYSWFISDTNFSELESIAKDQLSASPNWLLSAFLHVSFNVSVAFAMMAIIGSTEEDKKANKRGAILGGATLGIIALIVNVAVYLNIDVLQNVEMPMLQLANELSPIIGTLMSIALLGMIFSTAVPCFYTFIARFVEVDTNNFKISGIIVGIAAFILGFIGFSGLVNTVYPLLGYVGFVLIGSMIVYYFRMRRKSHIEDNLYENVK